MFDKSDRRGFDLVIKTTELRARLERRAGYHAKRAEFYGAKAEDFKEDIEAIPQSFENSTLGRHEDQLNRSRIHHVKQERTLRFYAQHLPKEPTVKLTSADISEFELLESTEA